MTSDHARSMKTWCVSQQPCLTMNQISPSAPSGWVIHHFFFFSTEVNIDMLPSRKASQILFTASAVIRVNTGLNRLNKGWTYYSVIQAKIQPRICFSFSVNISTSKWKTATQLVHIILVSTASGALSFWVSSSGAMWCRLDMRGHQWLLGNCISVQIRKINSRRAAHKISISPNIN